MNVLRLQLEKLGQGIIDYPDSLVRVETDG
jgi:hypothetical protein